MSIQVRYAQDIPDTPVVEVAKPVVGKDGVAGVAGVDGAAGADLIALPPEYIAVADGAAIVLDLAVSRQFRLTLAAECSAFSISFTNFFDGVKFSVTVVQADAAPVTPTFTPDIMWNLNAGPPTLDDINGQHSVYGFEYWEPYGAFDGYLLGKTFTPIMA